MIEFLIDEEHKLIVFKYNTLSKEGELKKKTIEVRCDERDAFDYRIGIGIAFDRLGWDNRIKPKIEKLFKSKNSYYIYLCTVIIEKFCNVGQVFDELVKKEQADYKERILKEQVRKYECELRGNKYKPNKITHKFIQVGANL